MTYWGKKRGPIAILLSVHIFNRAAKAESPKYSLITLDCLQPLSLAENRQSLQGTDPPRVQRLYDYFGKALKDSREKRTVEQSTARLIWTENIAVVCGLHEQLYKNILAQLGTAPNLMKRKLQTRINSMVFTLDLNTWYLQQLLEPVVETRVQTQDKL